MSNRIDAARLQPMLLGVALVAALLAAVALVLSGRALQQQALERQQLLARVAELKKREEAANAEAASKTDIGWGHQIRSYVLQPYQLVKDLRTGVTSTAPGDVLDGDLDRFMAAALSQRVSGEKVVVEDID